MTALSGPKYQPISGNSPEQCVILLHGLGADGQDLISLAPFFADEMPNTLFISPDAPFPCDMAPVGRQWFSLQDRSPAALLDGVTSAAPLLHDFIDQCKDEYYIEEKNIFLLGFSQGSMLALHTALRREETLGGVLAYSGALAAPSLLTQELTSKPPICLIHGTDDMIVPYQASQMTAEALKSHDIPCELHLREKLGHGIDQEGMELGRLFFTSIIGEEENFKHSSS